MANEMENFLNKEIGVQEEQMRRLAARMEELAGIDCPLGVCVFDARMLDTEHELDETQHRKEVIEGALRTLRQHGFR